MEDRMISIIMPFYNCGKVIRESLNSIRQQTYECFEVLMIDDGSTDDSKNYVLAFCKDSRFRYLYKKNSGVSGSRNYGLDIAQGKYIAFVDSDDILHKDFLKDLLDASIQNNNCIVACKHEEFNKKLIWDDRAYSIQEVILNKDFSHEDHWEAGVVWGKLYPSVYLKGIRFNEDYHVSEDTLFFTQTFAKTKTYYLVNKKLYGYRIQQDSAIHGNYNERKHTQIKALYEVSNLIKPYSEKDYFFLRGQIASVCKQAAKTYYKNDQIWNELKSFFCENRKYCKCTTLKQWFTDTLFYYFPNLFRWIARVSIK